MFICEIWLFVQYFPQFCKSDDVEVQISGSVSEGPFDSESRLFTVIDNTYD